MRRIGLVVVIALMGSACWAGQASAYVYWTNFRNGTTGNGTIGRANLDSTNPTPSFITGASGPTGVEVDGQHIYWTNLRNISIGRANLDGTNPTQAFITGVNPNAVAVDGQHIYWTNSGTNSIGRANLDGTHLTRSFITGVNFPADGMAVNAGSSGARPALFPCRYSWSLVVPAQRLAQLGHMSVDCSRSKLSKGSISLTIKLQAWNPRAHAWVTKQSASHTWTNLRTRHGLSLGAACFISYWRGAYDWTLRASNGSVVKHLRVNSPPLYVTGAGRC